MSLPPAITQNRLALLRLVGVLCAAVGLKPGGLVQRLPRQVHLATLRVLRPAESAMRRLIVVLARGLVAPSSSMRASVAPLQPIPRGDKTRVPCFPLFDARLRVGLPSQRHARGEGPRIGVPGFIEPDFSAERSRSPDPMVSGEQLCRRLHRLQRALEDLPGQARRLARWRARQARRFRPPPLRPGRPPGFRARRAHPVDGILRDCHDLALYALRPPDTS